MSIIPLIPKCQHITFHTGNILTWSRLKRQPPLSGTDEVLNNTVPLVQCWMRQQELRSLQYVHELAVECPLHGCQAERILRDFEEPDRHELGLNVKLTIWLERYSRGTVREAVSKALKSLGSTDCDTLILSIAGNSFLSNDLHLEDIKPIWQELEGLVESDVLARLGVADFSPELLEELFNWAVAKPRICQLHTQVACATPLQLRNFAAANAIQLLTHCDRADPLPQDRVRRTVGKAFSSMDASSWSVNWLTRVSSTYRHRGVVNSWGYVYDISR